MFNDVIRGTPFIGECEDEFFAKIYSCGISNCDDTLLTNLRALVFPRMEDNDSLGVCYDSRYVDIYSAKDTVNNFVGGAEGFRNALVIYETRLNKDTEKATKEIFESDVLKEMYPAWHRVEKVTAFFHKTMMVECFINPDLKTSLVIANTPKMWQRHYLQCAIPVFLPWFFDGDEKITPEEMELIDSLREKTSGKYWDCITKMAAAYDIREQRIRKLLAGFETRHLEREAKSLKENIEGIITRIESLREEIGVLTRERQDNNIKLLGLESTINEAHSSNSSELMDYFMRNDRLVLSNVRRNSLRFFVRDYLMFVDEDGAASVLNNPNSYFYHPGGGNFDSIIPHDDMKLLMEAILIDKKLKLRLCAAYEITLGESVRALSGFDYGAQGAGYFPNPHIDKYSCLGNYSRYINEFVQNGDYIGAIEQCVASCRSLNVLESPTMTEMMVRFYKPENYGVNIRCIELPNGEIVEPKEAIKWLKQEAASNEEGEDE